MKKSMALAIMLITLSSEIVLAQKPLYKAAFGIAPFTFRKSFPNSIPATLDTIKMMGFTEIEGGAGRMAPGEFKKLCNERGISIPGDGVGYDRLVKNIDSVIYTTKALGA